MGVLKQETIDRIKIRNTFMFHIILLLNFIITRFYNFLHASVWVGNHVCTVTVHYNISCSVTQCQF